jgi:TonB family protein
VLSAQVRIWADSSGRVTKVTLAKSTGDPAMDEILTTQTLRGLRLAEAPPQGMPMPITLKLTARRPE